MDCSVGCVVTGITSITSYYTKYSPMFMENWPGECQAHSQITFVPAHVCIF